MTSIRPYQPSDYEAVAHICRETLPPSLSSDPEIHRLAPYLWAHQFTHLSPATCFVLVDPTSPTVNGVVGYVVGTPDIPDFLARYGDYVDNVLARDVAKPDGPRQAWCAEDGSVNPTCLAQMAYDGAWLLTEGREDVAERFPATLHIDLLEGARAGGWGRKLIERFVASAGGAKGVHVGIAGDNGKVVPFYEKCGFVLLRGSEKETFLMGREIRPN